MAKISGSKIILNIFRSVFEWVPYSAIVTIINYISAAVMPAIATVASVGLFDSAARVLAGENVTNRLWLFAFLYLGTYLINDLLYYFFSIAINAGVYEKCTAAFRIELYEKAARLPFINYENAEILNQKERAEKAVNDETLSSIFNRCLAFGSSIVAIISVMMILAKYSIWLLPVSLLSVLPYLFARFIRGKEFFHIKRQQAQKTRLLDYLWGLFNNKQTVKEMRVMGFDSYITDKWASVRDEVNAELWKLSIKDDKVLLLCDAIRIVGYGLSIGIVLWLAVSGRVTIGVFGACLTAFLSVQNSTKGFLTDLGRIPEQIGFARDYYDFLSTPEERSGSVSFDGLKDRIEVSNMSFAYPNSESLAVKNVSFTIQKGEKIAILGENGSGKTTISKLILGLYPAKEGLITYDGMDVESFDKNSFYKHISLIQQNFVSYQLSLRENVAISDIGQIDNDASIWTALISVGLGGVVSTVENGGITGATSGGLDIQLGREFNGAELSGGQWQKLAIARGMFKQSDLIVLDEPTSALDPLIESEILTSFIEASADKTAIIISHRVGLCKLVDKIIVMKHGEVVEIGTHAELVERNGEYARLYTAQQMWYVG